MRDQALVAKLFDVNVAVDNEDTDLSDINRVALLNKHLVPGVISRLHTVTANGDHKVGLFCFCALWNEKLLSQIAVKNVTRAGRCRERT